jgi:hypothetical protein
MLGISCLVAPSRDHAFFKQTQFERLLGNDLLQSGRFAPQILDCPASAPMRQIEGFR